MSKHYLRSSGSDHMCENKRRRRSRSITSNCNDIPLYRRNWLQHTKTALQQNKINNPDSDEAHMPRNKIIWWSLRRSMVQSNIEWRIIYKIFKKRYHKPNMEQNCPEELDVPKRRQSIGGPSRRGAWRLPVCLTHVVLTWFMGDWSKHWEIVTEASAAARLRSLSCQLNDNFFFASISVKWSESGKTSGEAKNAITRLWSPSKA